ncbi:protein FAM174C [Nothobranchius furzeri]|nr:protein FAM174C [Nothobranchius furzeri]
MEEDICKELPRRPEQSTENMKQPCEVLGETETLRKGEDGSRPTPAAVRPYCCYYLIKRSDCLPLFGWKPAEFGRTPGSNRPWQPIREENSQTVKKGLDPPSVLLEVNFLVGLSTKRCRVTRSGTCLKENPVLFRYRFRTRSVQESRLLASNFFSDMKMTFRRLLSSIIVSLCWLFVFVVEEAVTNNVTAAPDATVKPSSQGNSTSARPVMTFDGSHVNSSMIQRALFVLIGITMIGVLYFLIRTVRLKKPSQRKKYGLLSNYDDSVEMEAVESEEDDTLYEARSLRR